MQRAISLAVVGADFDNKSGPTRRFEIAMCRPGEVVHLIPEPKNPADPRAIAVYSERHVQIGYIRAERASYIGGAIRRGGIAAIFQQAEKWGATIRAHLDGTSPVLPTTEDLRASDWPPPGSEGSEDSEWWPDEDRGWD